MKFAFVLIALALTLSAMADTYVNGYQKRDGTYVRGHYKTESNNTRNDNYSTSGNVNPYTGSSGTKPRDNYGYGSGRKKNGW